MALIQIQQEQGQSAALSVELAAVQKSFLRDGKPLPVLQDVDLNVPPGAFVAVVGPSGSGKSTLLSIIAGLDEPDAGSVRLMPRDGDEALSDRLGCVGYMPQRDLLLPWRTALANATVALELRGETREEARRIALPLFTEFGLEGFASSHPHELSGGMRQRVSFLRSALSSRGLMLLDEPFGALDALTRAAMQEWLLEAYTHMNATFVLVTHDVDEALLLSDTVYVLSPRPGTIAGKIDVQLPRPRTLDTTGSVAFANLRAELLRLLRQAGSLNYEGDR